MKFAYLLVNLGSVLIPFIFSFHPKLQFYKHFGAFAKGLFPVAVLFLVWDAIFTDIGVWGFNPDYLTEISLYNLPLEEVLFFICIPFACVFTYHCLKLFFSYQLPQQIQAWIIGVLVTILILVGLLHLERLYTSITLLSMAMVLIYLQWIVKPAFLSRFLWIYGVLLIPFVIVNGILTGTGLEAPIVWYNDNHNLGIRILTIPVEDSIYGFELLLLTVWRYDRALKKAKH